MKYNFIVFGSQTTAIKVMKNIMNNYQIKSEIIQTPKAIKLRSCSYCLKLNDEYTESVLKYLKSSNIYFLGVYDSNYEKIN